MVRLVITDFETKEESENFYMGDEYETPLQMFTYHSFKKHSVYLSRYEQSDEIYSLNLLSKKHLLDNQFLVYVEEDSFIILFNHKTVYSAKINGNFITDDIIKSTLITKHIAMLSSGGEIQNIYYLASSKYKNAIENILKYNTKNEKNEVIAKKLGEVETLVQGLNPLDTNKEHIMKTSYVLSFFTLTIWLIFFGLESFANSFSQKESLSKLQNEFTIEKRAYIRGKRIYEKSLNEYKQLSDCITKEEIK